jgi:DNA polymerase
MSDPTRFDLDDRQRAMLAEMGVRVWWPKRAEETGPVAEAGKVTPAAVAVQPMAASAPVAQAESPAQTLPATASTQPTLPRAPAQPERPRVLLQTPAVSNHPPLPTGLADMDWPVLQEAVDHCASCALCAARKAPILGAGHALAHWMVVGDLPGEEEDQLGQAFVGQEGVLLDNMLKAVGVRRQGSAPAQDTQPQSAQAYVTHAVKCRPPGGRNPEAAELAVCAAYLSRQVALVQPKVILAMGRFAIQSLLGSTEPMGKLRGRLHAYQGVPVVVTYPPSSLLRNQSDKAKAWADLVLALKVVKG